MVAVSIVWTQYTSLNQVGNAKLTDDEERAKDAPTWNMRLTALLVIRSSVWFGTGQSFWRPK